MTEITFECSEPRERICLVTVSGHVSASSADKFEKFLIPLVTDDRYDECIIDCRGVDYVSSLGLRVFMRAMQIRKKSKKSQLICRVASNSMFYKSLVMVGLSRYMTIRAS